ncbi:MAG: hypothetical protein AAF542_07210 [Pseudomonadota bacterium]
MITKALAILCCATLLTISEGVIAYQGSSFQRVYDAVFNKPYDTLPSYTVDKKLFGPRRPESANNLYQAAKRTLTQKDDLYSFPQQQKLLNANGICFSGKWHIDQPSPYSGLFSQGSRSLVIARASVALSGTTHADKRAFGMAIKLFPTSDENSVVHTVNAFVLHSMGGTRSKYVSSLAMDNAPSLGGLPKWSQLGTALRLRKELEAADKSSGSKTPDVAYRPVRHLAQVNSESVTVKNVVAPTLLRLRIDDTTARVNEPDFRDELRLHHYPEGRLAWSIDVSEQDPTAKSKAEWMTIGYLSFDKAVTSKACDAQLHFAHPIID